MDVTITPHGKVTVVGPDIGLHDHSPADQQRLLHAQALHLLGDDPVGLRIEGVDRDVERLRGIHDPDLGALGGGLPGVGFTLNEVGPDRRVGPGRLIQAPVEHDGLRDRDGLEGLGRVGG